MHWVQEMSSPRFNVGRFALDHTTPESQVLRMYDMAYDDRIAAIEAAPDGSFVDMHGMLFKLGPSHLRPSQLEPLRAVGDVLADAVSPHIVLDVKDKSHSRRGGLFDYGYGAVARVEAMHVAGDADATALVASMRAVPPWADMQRVRGALPSSCYCNILRMYALAQSFFAPTLLPLGRVS